MPPPPPMGLQPRGCCCIMRRRRRGRGSSSRSSGHGCCRRREAGEAEQERSSSSQPPPPPSSPVPAPHPRSGSCVWLPGCRWLGVGVLVCSYPSQSVSQSIEGMAAREEERLCCLQTSLLSANGDACCRPRVASVAAGEPRPSAPERMAVNKHAMPVDAWHGSIIIGAGGKVKVQLVGSVADAL